MVRHNDLARIFFGDHEKVIASMGCLVNSQILLAQSFAPGVKLLGNPPYFSVFKTNVIIVNLLRTAMSNPPAALCPVMLLGNAVYHLGCDLIITHRHMFDPILEQDRMNHRESDQKAKQGKQKPEKEQRIKELDHNKKDRHKNGRDLPFLIGRLRFLWWMPQGTHNVLFDLGIGKDLLFCHSFTAFQGYYSIFWGECKEVLC